MEKMCLLFLISWHTICSTVNYIINGGFEDPVITPATSIIDACPTNWTCNNNLQILGSQVTPLILYGQFVDMEKYGFSNLSQVIQLPDSGTCNLNYRQGFFPDWSGYYCILQIWWNGVLMATKPKATIVGNLQRIVVRGVQGPNVLLLKQVGPYDNGGSLIDNFSLVCIFDKKPINATEEKQEYILSTTAMQSFSSILSVPLSTLPSAHCLYLFLSDLWLYSYDIRNYTGVMNEIFATATFIDNTKLEILSVWMNFSSYKHYMHFQKYMQFTKQKFVENEGSSPILLDSNFQFFIFTGPQIILSSLLFYFLFLLLKDYKISLFFRPYYFLKTAIMQCLLQQNISYFVYVCFSHLQISFFFWFYDKLSLFLTVLFLFCVIFFSLCFYYMLSKYLKGHSNYFHVKINKRLAGYSLLTFKNLVRPFLRGSVYFFLRYFYQFEMLTLSFVEVLVLFLSLAIHQNFNIYQCKTHFCLQILYHSLHSALNFILSLEYVLEGQDYWGKQQMLSFALQTELIIIYLLITLTLLGMFYDILPLKSQSKKGKQLHEKVSKKILIKKEDINKENSNFQIQESGNLLKGVNYQLFQKQNKQQSKLKVKESDIFGQLRVQVMANMELFPK